MSIEPQAYSISDFCRRFGIGTTKTYEEIKAGRLRAVNAGGRTLIPAADAQAWFESLPRLHTAA